MAETTKEEVLARLKDLSKKRTPGDWKLWGMSVFSDQDGSGDVDHAQIVASTYLRDENGAPRTFDADLICTLVYNMPWLLEAAEAGLEQIRLAEDLKRKLDEAEFYD